CSRKEMKSAADCRVERLKVRRSYWRSKVSFCNLLKVPPVVTDAYIHLQRNTQGMDFLHVLAHQRPHGIDFGFRNFKHQLVMHLQSHSRFEVLITNRSIDAYHGDFYQ